MTQADLTEDTDSTGGDLTIAATDGFELAATVFEPASAPLGAVGINPALGVPRGFYRAYADYLAGRGFAVVTYDVRGNGGSRPKNLKGFPGRMSDWAERDMAGVFAWAKARWPDTKLFTVGHSAGGQTLGLAPNAHLVEGFIGVAAIAGNPRHWRGLRQLHRRFMVSLLVYVLMPGMARLLGHFPGTNVGFTDLPRDVALQWSQWVRHPDYLFGDPSLDLSGYAAFEAPILAISFEDDTYVAAHAREGVMGRYENADITWRHVHPRDVGRPAIGHFGFFKDGLRDTLWAETADWLAKI